MVYSTNFCLSNIEIVEICLYRKAVVWKISGSLY